MPLSSSSMHRGLQQTPPSPASSMMDPSPTSNSSGAVDARAAPNDFNCSLASDSSSSDEVPSSNLLQQTPPPLISGDDGGDGDGGGDVGAGDKGKEKLKGKKKKKVEKRKREPRFAFLTKTDVDLLDDGFRWRKYGQKPVKNSPFPRSYYRCTVASCGVKKMVERSSADPSMIITTYEGHHSHPIVPCPTLVSHPTPFECSSTAYNYGVGVDVRLYNQYQLQLPPMDHPSSKSSSYFQSLVDPTSPPLISHDSSSANSMYVSSGLLEDMVPFPSNQGHNYIDE